MRFHCGFYFGYSSYLHVLLVSAGGRSAEVNGGDHQHAIVSILCPTSLNVVRFLKFFQRSGKAIREGDIFAKLLLGLYIILHGVRE